MTKIVIFNAPPSSGKDVAAHWCAEKLPNVKHRAFKEALFRITSAIYNVTEDFWEEGNNTYTYETKNVPLEIFGGLSPRQALIKVSEDVIKPVYGQSFFGEDLANSIGCENVVLSDGGFFEELMPLVSRFGKENILIVKIKREGYTFEGDSRSYLPEGHCKTILVENTMPEKDNDVEFELFRATCLKIVKDFFKED